MSFQIINHKFLSKNGKQVNTITLSRQEYELVLREYMTLKKEYRKIKNTLLSKIKTQPQDSPHNMISKNKKQPAFSNSTKRSVK